MRARRERREDNAAETLYLVEELDPTDPRRAGQILRRSGSESAEPHLHDRNAGEQVWRGPQVRPHRVGESVVQEPAIEAAAEGDAGVGRQFGPPGLVVSLVEFVFTWRPGADDPPRHRLRLLG